MVHLQAKLDPGALPDLSPGLSLSLLSTPLSSPPHCLHSQMPHSGKVAAGNFVLRPDHIPGGGGASSLA